MTRVLLDACVLYPTVMREIILGVAAEGVFTPLWSARILEEWARAVARNIPQDAEVARVEIALLQAKWTSSSVAYPESALDDIFLPDADDRHVLAAAITGKADVLLTLNLKDFPTRTLGTHGILRLDPDHFLRGLLQDYPHDVAKVCEAVRATAERLSGEPQPMRPLLKKARMPRLAKALS